MAEFTQSPIPAGKEQPVAAKSSQPTAPRKPEGGALLIPVKPAEPERSTRESRVQRRAYELFLERGGEHGRDQEDWLRAEREVLAEEAAGKAGAR